VKAALNKRMAEDTLNLTGFWKGVFSYPHSLPPNQFDAELREHAGLITGETSEHGRTGQTLHGMIEGQRHGFEVGFSKLYDAMRRATTPVHYSGILSGDGTEISGTWTIPGSWSGTFLMVRAKPKAIAVERKVAETVR